MPWAGSVGIPHLGDFGCSLPHIPGAIAALERGIAAERGAEDMKLRAKRGKWNGDSLPRTAGACYVL